LPKGDPEGGGRFRSSRTPYTSAIVRACVDLRYKRVIAVMGSQMGKTSSFLSVIGHRLDDDPTPVLYIGPSQGNVQKVIEPKIMDMIKLAPSLKNKLVKGRSNGKTSKQVGGVKLRLAWAGSPTELASDNAGIVFVDEIDKVDANKEGNTFEQAEARTSAFVDGKTIGTSTPTQGSVETYLHPVTKIEHWKVGDPEAIGSAIWKLWQTGTRHEWAVPCKHCQQYFVPRIKLLKWAAEGSVTKRARTARLHCIHCGGAHEDTDKLWMNSRGYYLAPGEYVLDGKVVGECETADSDTASFWASGIMAFSAKKTFEFLARKLIRGYHSNDPETLQSIVNTDFGECFSVQGEAPKAGTVAMARGSYVQGEYPKGIVLLTAGVDVQKSRLLYVVRGWGYGLNSWLIDYGELFGETDQIAVWRSLYGILTSDYGGMMIRRMAVDSGFRPDPVYKFCQDNPALAVPTKGRDHIDRPYYSAPIEVNEKGNRVRKLGIHLWHVDTDVAKSWVHARVNEVERRWWLPSNVSDDYCNQISNEQRVSHASGKVVWVKRGENHYLDCEAGAYMAMRTLNAEPALLQPQAPPLPMAGRRVRSEGVRQ
jgi:phage terminase large subunit GpA-like protein